MIPPELVQLGSVGMLSLAVVFIVMSIKPGLTALVDAQKNLTTVNTDLLAHLRESDKVIDRNAEALERSAAEKHEMRLSITALAAAQTELVKVLPETVAAIVKANTDMGARLDAHDLQAREGIARIEAKLGTLSDEIKAGHKVTRAEMLEQIGLVLAEIATLKTPPPEPTPPVAVSTFTVVERPAEPAQEKAA